MTARFIPSLVVGVALASAPLAVDARVLMVPGCGGKTHLLVIPHHPTAPGKPDPDDCAKACHAVLERRDRSIGKKGCCG